MPDPNAGYTPPPAPLAPHSFAPTPAPTPTPLPYPSAPPSVQAQTPPVQTHADCAPAIPVAPEQQHTAAEEEFLDNLYAQLKPMAVDAYVSYFLARTPAHLQNDMKDLLKADLETPPSVPPEALLVTA